MKKIIISCLVILIIGLVILIIIRIRGASQTNNSWSLEEQGATYIIHGAQDYDTGPGYYLYKIKEGKTSIAKIDSESSTNLTHFTDRPVRIRGKVKIESGNRVVVSITDVERAE